MCRVGVGRALGGAGGGGWVTHPVPPRARLTPRARGRAARQTRHSPSRLSRTSPHSRSSWAAWGRAAAAVPRRLFSRTSRAATLLPCRPREAARGAPGAPTARRGGVRPRPRPRRGAARGVWPALPRRQPRGSSKLPGCCSLTRTGTRRCRRRSGRFGCCRARMRGMTRARMSGCGLARGT